MTNVTLHTATRQCLLDNYFLGYEGENKINKLIFKFDDGFRDGLGILNIQRGEEKGYLDLEKVGNTYELEVKSALLTKNGEITFQLTINEPGGTVIKYDTFTMIVKDVIDADSEMPEDYPNWVDMANAKLAEVDEAISDVETAIQNANGVADTLLQARQNGEFDGRDGEDGTDGVSPVVTTQQTSTGSTITITDAVGTHTATLSNGRDGTDGVDGISSEVSVKTNTETEYVLTITDKNGSFDTPNLKGTNAENGILSETDPIYSADKPNLALKTEIPTKTSQLANDSNYITSYTETDPTVPSHVKAITETDITNWNNKSNFSGSYNDLTDVPEVKDGKDGLTPYIGENGNWWIGEEDTGVGAGGTGGSGAKIDILFNGRTEELNVEYNLNFNVNDYDLLIVEANIPKSNSLITSTVITTPVSNQAYAMGTHYGGTGSSYFLTFMFPTNTSVSMYSRNGVGDDYWKNPSIVKIVGIKF